MSVVGEGSASPGAAQSEVPLRARSLTLPGVLMQALAHVAPAIGILAFIPMITSFSGVTSPLAYLIAFLIVLTLGASLVQLAKHLPAAGGYFTYISRTVHPRAGFLAAWMFFLIEVLAPGAGLGFGGIILQDTIKAEYGLTFPWWAFLIAGTVIIAAVSYFGIRIAVGVAVVLGIIEVTVLGVLAIFALTDPGPGGINLTPFDPTNSISTSGLSLAVVFAIFAFAGFESVAPLAEETANPRRILPRAIMMSLVLTGVFYVFTAWAFLVGWGTADVESFVGSAENPVFSLARQHWGGAWIIVFLVLVNSILAIGLAASNAATRVMFATARSGALPAALAKVHPTHRTPINAIFLQAAVTLVFGLTLGLAVGPLDLFFTVGLAATLSLILLYISGNVGVLRYYLRERRAEFKPLLHVVFPVVSSVALIVVAYKSLNPLPPSPTWWGAVGAAVWLLAGITILGVMHRTGRERWLLNAGAVFQEDPEPADRTS